MSQLDNKVSVLLDNFTLQGAYCYLERGKRGRLFENILSHLVECIVLYDSIYVPEDVLARNSACQYIAKQFDNVISGKSMPATPDIHHHVIDKSVVEGFRFLIDANNPFAPYEGQDAYYIEQVGNPFASPLGWMGRYETPLTFAERHTYYTWYCVRLSAALGINYAPNPTRVNLFSNSGFLQLPIFPNAPKDFLKKFEEAWKHRFSGVGEWAESFKVEIELPLIYNYVKSATKNGLDLIAATKKLRDSRNAVKFRQFCREMEKAYQDGDQAAFDEGRAELEELSERWSKSLTKTKAKKRWTVSHFVGTDFQTPWFNLGAVDRKPHFVFLHKLLSIPPAKADV